MAAATAAGEQIGLGIESFSRRDMEERFPEHYLDADEVGILDATQGYLRCEQALLTAISRAGTLGARIHDYTKITIKRASASGVVLSDGLNEWKAKKVVVTTGSWSGEHLTRDLQGRSRARRIRLTWFSPKSGHDFGPEAFPVFNRLVADGLLYGAPTLDGGGSVKIAPGAAPTEMNGPEDYLRGQTLEEIHYMERHVEKYFPGVHKSPIRANAWTDFYVDDWTPFLGFLPGSQSVVLANGFAGFGFKMAPGVGRIAADIVQGRKATQFKFMDPSRVIGNYGDRKA